VGLVGRPVGARIDRHPARQRRLRQPRGVHGVRQRHPQEDSTFRIVELGRGPEMLGERFHQCIELHPQAARELRHVLAEMLRAKLAQDHLLERAGAGVGLERKDTGENLPRRHDVADP
jgi:hypothetical protein